MQLLRPAIAVHPRFFGKGPKRVDKAAPPFAPVASRLSRDIKLFVTTFAAGFVFVSVLLA